MKLDIENKTAVAEPVRQLIEDNRIPDDNGDTVFNFADGRTIKRIHVTNDTRRELVNGRYAIVRLDEKYEVVPNGVAEKIKSQDASCIVLYHSEIN